MLVQGEATHGPHPIGRATVTYCSQAGSRMGGRSSGKILVWLKDYVCPVVEEYVNDARFRSHARWPLDVLAGSTLSSVPKLVRDVDGLLVTAAKGAPGGRREQGDREEHPQSESTQKNDCEGDGREFGQRSAVAGRCLGRSGFPAPEASAGSGVAEHCYADLVCRDDYFGPVGSLLPPKELAEIRKKQPRITEGALSLA